MKRAALGPLRRAVARQCAHRSWQIDAERDQEIAVVSPPLRRCVVSLLRFAQILLGDCIDRDHRQRLHAETAARGP